ncbi:unnamed protein product [Knipowitschia caucasica]
MAFEESGNKEYAFRVRDVEMGSPDVKKTGLMVDAGATSHIITDITKFKKFDGSFQAGTHCVELADGSRCQGVAKRRGDAEEIFSVKAATTSGATVIFSEKNSILLHRDGTTFPIHVYNKLFGRHGG